MIKQRESKLDQHAATLEEMELGQKTLAEMQAWLKDEGITCSLSTLSRFLESQRSRRLQSSLLAQIASGAQQCKEVEKSFGTNPAPEVETLIKLHRVLILQLSTQGNANPAMLQLADQLTRTALEFVSGQTKAAFKERELTIEETKFAESKKNEQTKALEFCLDEAKEFPAVQELFKTAFAALKKVRAGLATNKAK